MTNPYENLWIYYLDGIPDLPVKFHKHSSFIGNWEEDGFSFFFFSAPADDYMENMLENQKNICLIDRYEMSCEQWHGEKIESYTTGNFCVSPPWKIPFLNRPGVRKILLDPGVVFGTGRHQTTESCLGYLEYLCEKEDISTVLDIGTGTGLLALGAASLGCKTVLALDFNLLAVKTALNNIKLNDFQNRILAVQGRAEDFTDMQADLVIANIHYDVMKNLLDAPEFIDNKWFILSGLLRTESGKILEKLSTMPVKVVEAVCPDGVWHTILGKANQSMKSASTNP